uniref:ADP-ribose pyrophosphatase n=1 Tax=uncultured Armatimonadetes bacterium TaxID=157466 RepID=A0A6J4IU00_9BACT|nr:ADP-ribose pyrophosphatase [uncultured Armatimonadetes bacterium]
MDLTETVTGTRRVYDGRVVNLRVDSVRLPNGKESKREVVEHGGAVAMVPMRDRETVLLVRQWRLPAGKALLEIPAGGMEEGEAPEVCAARELAEEIGMVPGRLLPLYSCYLAPGYSTERIHGFLALDLRHAPEAADEDEFVEVVPMALEEAIARIATGEIEDAKTIAGLTLAARLLPTL